MATGDQNDMIGRIKQLLPRWFNDGIPILGALITGAAYALSFVYDLIGFSKIQTRIKTATEGWLDLIAFDFFGNRIKRLANQSDTSFRNKILVNLFRERGTRQAVVNVLTDLTGRAPIIFEPQRPADTGAYNTNTMGYGIAGGYGSMQLPYQCFITAYRPAGQGIPLIAGYGISTGAYSTPSRAVYAKLDNIAGVTDADIYDAVDNVKPVGTIAWVRISS